MQTQMILINNLVLRDGFKRSQSVMVDIVILKGFKITEDWSLGKIWDMSLRELREN